MTGEAGCLLIVKNYTGDRLNFGLAAEQAGSEYGLKVRMVVVSDDVALPDAPQPRGIAGTVFVHKVAGAAAEAGLSLDEVQAEAERVAASVASLGLALSGCTLPGQAPDTRLGVGEIELGLGIHGEEGTRRGQHDTADALTELLLGTLLQSRRGAAVQGRAALLLNNLGTVTPMELLILTRAAVAGLAGRGVRVERLYVGNYMTSLDMKGYSLSLLPLDDQLLQRLDAPADASGWTVGAALSDPARSQEAPAVQEELLPARSALTPETTRLEAAIRAAAQSLIDHEAQLTAWDKQVGDGDCGTTLRRGAERVLADLGTYPLQDARGTLLGLARSVSASMGGSTGVLYAIFFRAAAQAVGTGEGGWAALFGAGVDALGQYGGASEGDRTMMDALLPAGREAQQSSDLPTADLLGRAAAAAETGADATRHLTKAGAGRSAYLSAQVLEGTPDPGAVAVALWLRALADTYRGPQSL